MGIDLKGCEDLNTTRRKQEKGNKIQIIAILILLVLVTVFSGKLVKKLISNTVCKKNRTLELVCKSSINWDKNSQIEFINDKIIYYNNKKINWFNLKGKNIATKSIDLYSPLVKISENGILIADSTRGIVKLLDLYGNILWEKKVNNIKQISENSGKYIIQDRTMNKESQVKIFNKSGQIYTNYKANDGKIINSYINIDEDIKIYTILDIQNSVINNKMLVFNKDQNLSWDKEFNEEIIQKIVFLNNDKVVVVTDEKIYAVKNGKILWSKQIVEDLIYVGANEDKDIIYIVKRQNIEFIDIKGRIKEKIDTDISCKRVVYYDNKLYTVGYNEIIGYDIQGNKILYFKNDEKIMDFCIKNNRALIITEKYINVMNIIDLN